MDPALMKKVAGMLDARSTKGIMARGKPKYPGGTTSPNPAGINGNLPKLAAMALAKRKAMQNGPIR